MSIALPSSWAFQKTTHLIWIGYVLILGHAALTKRQVKHAVDKLHEE